MKIGDVVHYVLPDGPRAGECRAAIIIRRGDPVNRIVVLHVLTDGVEDSPRFRDTPVRVTSAAAEPFRMGTWHPKDDCSETV